MTTRTASNPSYGFLSHPPESRTQPSEPRPSTPSVRTISRRRSSTVTAISAWVAGVLPGSPAPRSPPEPSTFSRRPSLFGSQHSPRKRSKSFISFTKTYTPHAKDQDSNLHAPTYSCTVVPLPIPPYTSAASQSLVPAEREDDDNPDEMKKLSHFTFMHQRKASAPAPGPPSPTLPKKKGLMRFFLPRSRSRSTHTPRSSPPPPSAHALKVPPLPPSCSPTTVAFRIAHQKRALYAQRGLLPLPLDSEVAIMQFVDGGSRTDAAARLGATFKDAAGIVYTDEAEARECLPLLLSVESDSDDTNLPSAPSGMSEGLAFTSPPPSPLFPMNLPPAPALPSPAQLPAASPPRALLSIPARGGGTSVPGYLHAALPPLPLPFGDVGSKTQFALPAAATASHRKQRRRPAPLALHFPAHAVGFEDSFVPNVVIEVPSPTEKETLKTTRRE